MSYRCMLQENLSKCYTGQELQPWQCKCMLQETDGAYMQCRSQCIARDTGQQLMAMQMCDTGD